MEQGAAGIGQLTRLGQLFWLAIIYIYANCLLKTANLFPAS
jgi:hypothetical protein